MQTHTLEEFARHIWSPILPAAPGWPGPAAPARPYFLHFLHSLHPFDPAFRRPQPEPLLSGSPPSPHVPSPSFPLRHYIKFSTSPLHQVGSVPGPARDLPPPARAARPDPANPFPPLLLQPLQFSPSPPPVPLLRLNPSLFILCSLSTQ
jgi:hypothetical protein